MQIESKFHLERIHIDTERMPVRRTLCERTLGQLVRKFRRDPASVPPILVWPDPAEPERLMVVSGCHRAEAARIAGATHIAAEVLQRSEADAATIALIELIRPGRPASAWDTAQAMMVLSERLDHPSGRSLAERLGRGHTQVAQYLRVGTELPEADVREALRNADMDTAALRELPLAALYKIATSDDSLMDARCERLVDEVRTRRSPKDSTAGVPKANPTDAAAPDPRRSGWAGIGVLLALAGAVVLLSSTPVRGVRAVRRVRNPDVARPWGRP